MTEPETGPRGHDIANGIMAIPALEQLARGLAGQVKLVKVNVEHADHPFLASAASSRNSRLPGTGSVRLALLSYVLLSPSSAE